MPKVRFGIIREEKGDYSIMFLAALNSVYIFLPEFLTFVKRK